MKVQDKFRIQRFWCGDSGLGVTLGLQINQSRYCSSASGPKTRSRYSLLGLFSTHGPLIGSRLCYGTWYLGVPKRDPKP